MSETALKIKIYGDSILRKRALPVKEITQGHRDILSSMSRIMYGAGGIGLAAPQLGINEAMFVVDIGSGLYKLINPKITRKEGTQVMEEGCLSVPEVCIKVKRAKKILLEARDEFSRTITLEAQDLLARVFQHELDHLKGKLIVDYASFFDKLKIAKKLEELSRQANEIEGGIPPPYQIGLAGKKRAKDERLSGQEAKSCKLQL